MPYRNELRPRSPVTEIAVSLVPAEKAPTSSSYRPGIYGEPQPLVCCGLIWVSVVTINGEQIGREVSVHRQEVEVGHL